MDVNPTNDDVAPPIAVSNNSRLTLERCGFCCVKSNLFPCLQCYTVAYCTREHQEFDWKRHKPLCKTIQSKMAPSTEEINKGFEANHSLKTIPFLDAPKTEQSIFSSATAFKPYVKKSSSEASIGSSVSDSLLTSTILNVTPSLTSFSLGGPSTVPFTASPISTSPIPSTSGISAVHSASLFKSETNEEAAPEEEDTTKELIIETDDPDIQIIETPGSKNSRSRKRPTSCSPAPVKLFKDHSLNKPYNVSPEDHRKLMISQNEAINRQQSAELRLAYIADHIQKNLIEYGWAVIDEFLGDDHCTNINKEVQVLESRGLFTAGQLVENKKDEQHVKDVRSDKTYWFSGSDVRSSDACTVRMLTSCVDGVMSKISNGAVGHIIQGRSKAMLAVYPGHGTRYIKHVDNPSRDGRRITVIYYCNPGWDYRVDGGALRLYPANSSVPFDIEPKFDRLLVFWSDNRMPHEVLPVYKDRYAITIWYMDRAEREKHIERGKKKKEMEAVRMSAATSMSSIDSSDAAPKSPKERRLDDEAVEERRLQRRIVAPVEMEPEPEVKSEQLDSGIGSSIADPLATIKSIQSALAFNAPRNPNINISNNVNSNTAQDPSSHSDGEDDANVDPSVLGIPNLSPEYHI